MADRRMIASNIFEDEWFGVQEPLTQVIWIGLIATIADDQGRFLWSIPLIRAKLFPYKDMSLDTIQAALDEIAAAGKIYVYSMGDKAYCQISAWWRYQNPSWAAPSKYPSPEGWMDRIRWHVSKEDIRLENWNTPGGFVVTPLPSALPSQLPSALARGIEENRIVKREGENVVEFSSDSTDPVAIMAQAIQTLTGYPITPNPAEIKALEEMVKIGVTEDDIRGALSFLSSNGKLARGPSRLLGSVQTEVAKRTQKANAKPSGKPYIPEEHASEVY